MDNLPNPEELRQLYAGNPVVDRAEQALRHFGVADGQTELAAQLLTSWEHADELSERERAAVVARFDLVHPAWCSPAHCTITPTHTYPTGVHLAEPCTAADPHGGHYVVTLSQSGHPGSVPMITVVHHDGPTARPTLVLSWTPRPGPCNCSLLADQAGSGEVTS